MQRASERDENTLKAGTVLLIRFVFVSRFVLVVGEIRGKIKN